MAKIDCSVTVNFFRERRRMCDSYRQECKDCVLRRVNRFPTYTCSDHMYTHPDTAIEIVQKWSDEHPVKTRLDDLLKKYPKTYISSGNTPSIRPYMLGYCENCDDCVYSHCEAEVCWHEPFVGGATGKAVE